MWAEHPLPRGTACGGRKVGCPDQGLFLKQNIQIHTMTVMCYSREKLGAPAVWFCVSGFTVSNRRKMYENSV